MKIDEFLKKIALEIKVKDREFSKEDFYYILKYIGIKKEAIYKDDIEKFYEDFLNNLNNSLVKYTQRKVKSGENSTYYIGFYVDKKAHYLEAVKVYFPVKYEYLISALKTVFLYIIRNNIKAQVKFNVKATNEGIVIRFYDKNEALPFINYCHSNFVLKDLLEHVNPFIATIYGIGICYDDNQVSTYNQTVCSLLEDYFKFKKSLQALDQVSDLDFLDFVSKRWDIEEDERVRFNKKAVLNNIKAILNQEMPVL